MVNKEELNSLIWKYFWEQKKKEVLPILKLLVICLLSFGGIYLILFLSNYDWFMFIIIFIAVIVIVGLIIIEIYKWIKSNWKKAEARAKEKLKYKNKK